MKLTLKKIARTVLGCRLVSLCRDYSTIPGLLLRELLRLISLIRHRRKYANDPEVILAGARTAAHILDKGLQADDWRNGRSRAQYARLCMHLKRLEESSLRTDPSFRWALDKKSEYEKAQENVTESHASVVSAPSGITEEALLQLIQGRRSVRAFEQRSIDPSLLAKLAEVVNWSPNSCNRQPAKLFVTQTPQKVCKCIRACRGATCFGRTIPCFISVCADSRFYRLCDRNLPFIDVALGLQNMLLLAHYHGIDGTVLNWMNNTLTADTILRETLDIPEYYVVVVNLVLGYPMCPGPVPARKDAKLTYTFVD